MEKNAISLLVSFILTCLIFIIIVSYREITRLNADIKLRNEYMDSVRIELELEEFEKNRYINIVEQLSTSDCPDVKRIIHGK
jgi:hypothetical protein